MAKNLIPCDRDQRMLMPPDMREWLPPDHLAWFVIDSVEQLDLKAFYARHRDDGWGRAAFDPGMMVTLLLYAYAVGVRSSREIERRLTHDVACRVIAANERIDHATICRFRTRYRDELSELFVSTVGLCVAAGMVRPGVVIVDGTKVAANASGAKNLSAKQLEDFARRVFDEAEAIDAQEDERLGSLRGDEMPEHLRKRPERIEWLRQKLAEQQEQAAKETASNKTIRKPRINMTDPDSAVQRTPHGYLQGYNAQAAVTPEQIVVAADLTGETTDVAQLEPMITQAKANLATVGAAPPATILADAGYFSEDNAALKLDVELLIAPAASRRLDDAIARRRPPAALNEHAERRWQQELGAAQRSALRRAEVIAALDDGHITRTEAAQELSLSIHTVNWLRWQKRRFGHLPKARMPAPPPRPSAREVMLERFADPVARDKYRLRATIEPVFGQLKEQRGLRRFVHRGKQACRCEWRMAAAAHNLRKLSSGGANGSVAAT